MTDPDPEVLIDQEPCGGLQDSREDGIKYSPPSRFSGKIPGEPLIEAAQKGLSPSGNIPGVFSVEGDQEDPSCSGQV